MNKPCPSKQLVDHAISVVLEKRYRRALKNMMPNAEIPVTHSCKRETGRGPTRMKKYSREQNAEDQREWKKRKDTKRSLSPSA